MGKNSILEGVKFAFGVSLFFVVVFGLVYAAGFHYPSEIVPGAFQAGDYSFNGSLGIGTSSFERELNINSSTGAQIRLEGVTNANWNGIELKSPDFQNYFGMLESNGNFFVDTGSNGDDLVILQNGNVGIGTTTPNSLLEVSTTISGKNSEVRIFKSSGNDTDRASLKIGYNDAASFEIYRTRADGTIYLDSKQNTDIQFKSAGTNTVTFQSNGNVGIGTTTPTASLQIGQLYNNFENGNIIGASNPKRLVINGGYSGGIFEEPALTLGFYSSAYGLDIWVNESGLAPVYFDQRNSDAFIFRTNTRITPVEVMRIAPNGNVGIGTTTPTQKLDLGSGSIKIGGGALGSSGNVILSAYTADTCPVGWITIMSVNHKALCGQVY